MDVNFLQPLQGSHHILQLTYDTLLTIHRQRVPRSPVPKFKTWRVNPWTSLVFCCCNNPKKTRSQKELLVNWQPLFHPFYFWNRNGIEWCLVLFAEIIRKPLIQLLDFSLDQFGRFMKILLQIQFVFWFCCQLFTNCSRKFWGCVHALM